MTVTWCSVGMLGWAHVGGKRLNYHNLSHPQPHNPLKPAEFLISVTTQHCLTTTHEVRVRFPKFHDISYLLSKQPLEGTAYDSDFEEVQIEGLVTCILYLVSKVTCIWRRCQQAQQGGVSQCPELAFAV